ncbi:MAG: plasmid mobilization protein [Catenisphaera adipataccumulans]|jgi:hypothetical protein|uniref:plasmid mobilization protein n=1 Tax=Catenisphaera adipataccumulans TaxID=700500 RepID=UPI003D8A9565
MACERKARFRHNTIAFWLSDEEKKAVEARIILSGLPKGEYYRQSILGQQIQINGGRYRSAKLAAELESLYQRASEHKDAAAMAELIQVLSELLAVWKAGEDNE